MNNKSIVGALLILASAVFCFPNLLIAFCCRNCYIRIHCHI